MFPKLPELKLIKESYSEEKCTVIPSSRAKRIETMIKEGKVEEIIKQSIQEGAQIGDYIDIMCSYVQQRSKEKTYSKKEIVEMLTRTNGACGKRWKYGDVAFKCKTCQTDSTCAICQECFLNGNHEGHDYSIITTSDGLCDCGDPDSWDPAGFCSKHK